MVVRFAALTLPPISISLGLAIYGEHGMTTAALLRAADGALYEVKCSGRDCMAVASRISQDSGLAPAMLASGNQVQAN